MTEQPTLDFPAPRTCPFDPAPALREQEPVSRVHIWDDSTPWLFTSYDDQRQALSDSRLSSDFDLPGFPSSFDSARAKTFISMDNPEHNVQRRMLTKNFLVKRVDAMRPRIQEIVDGLIDDMLAGPKPVDLVTSFALPLPSLVICELLGVPYADHDFFQTRSNKLLTRTSTREECVVARGELTDYLVRLVEIKDETPTDDVISQLVVEQLRTETISKTEIADMCVLLLIAGHETTANMVALGTLALLQHPDQLDELRSSEDPKFFASATEELLRYLTIVHLGGRRTATEDLEIGGQLVKAGEGVILATSVGNRDATAFEGNPDELDIHRDARHHMAFGYGIHQCLGQPLARAELQIVYSTLYRRIPTLRLAIELDDVEFKDDMAVYGVHALPITW